MVDLSLAVAVHIVVGELATRSGGSELFEISQIWHISNTEWLAKECPATVVDSTPLIREGWAPLRGSVQAQIPQNSPQADRSFERWPTYGRSHDAELGRRGRRSEAYTYSSIIATRTFLFL